MCAVEHQIAVAAIKPEPRARQDARLVQNPARIAQLPVATAIGHQSIEQRRLEKLKRIIDPRRLAEGAGN